MEDLDLKMNYIIGKIGKLTLSDRLGVSYPYLQKLLNNLGLINLNQSNIINEIYKELRNE